MIIDNYKSLPTAYSYRTKLEFSVKISGEELQEKIRKFLSELTADLKENGCKLIGHVKGIIDAGNIGYLMFSVTSFNEELRFKGNLAGNSNNIELTLNIIVYGIEKGAVELVCLRSFRKNFK